MIEHPLVATVFVIANVATACGFTLVASQVWFRTRIPSRWVRGAAVVFCACSALAHLLLVRLVIFSPLTQVQVAATSWLPLLAHSLSAAGLWWFLAGIYVQSGSWRSIPSYHDRPDDDDDAGD